MALPDPPEPAPHPEPLHERVDQAKEMLEAGGVELPGVTPMLILWRKLGIKGVALIVLFFGLPLGEYSALRYAVYTGLPRMVGGFGLKLEVGEWSLSPFSLSATARDVKVSGPTDDAPVLTAREVEFQGSIGTLLRGLPDMLTFHIFGGDQPFHEVVVRNGELHLERSLSGRLNIDTFVAAVPQSRIDDALEGVYEIETLQLDDFRVTYIEHVPGGSGDGVIRTSQAQVKVDEISGTVTELVRPARLGDQPTRFKVNGRSADGLFEVSGTAALFLPEGVEPAPVPSSGDGGGVRVVSTAGPSQYPYEVSVYLENIAAGAYGRMVPVTTIVPTNGIIEGKTTIVRTTGAPECQGGFTMRNVRFAPNPLVLTRPEQVDVVRRGVENVVYTGPFELCEASGLLAAAGTTERPAAIVLTNLTRQATATASPGVRALVDRDHRALNGEQVEMTVDSLTAALARDLGVRLANAIGGQTGQVVGQSLQQGSTQKEGSTAGNAGRAVVGGVKSVGSGIRRLFGGGSNRQRNDQQRTDQK